MVAKKSPPLSVQSQIATPSEGASESELNEYLKTLERVKAYKEARTDLLTFAKLMMPLPDDPENPFKSQYQVAKHHAAMATALHKVADGSMPRLIITMPPRHGKSQLGTKFMIPWYSGQYPYNSIALATYNSDFAGDFGRDVRSYIQSDVFAGIFPEYDLRKGSAASDRMTTEEGGQLVFVGAGGALTGRGFHLGIIDDPFKDAEEADSQTIRDKRWEWFVKVFMTRQMEAGSSIVITLTRWHEDDIVGRLTDKSNPHFNEEESKQWKILNLPFFAKENDPLRRKEGEVLWPEKFDREFGEAQRRLSARAFNALYQQEPTTADGSYFKKAWFNHYESAPPKDSLRIYAASDHAVGVKQTNDKTCMVVVGVDSQSQIFVLDVVWGRFDAEQQIDKMIDLMEKWRPLIWWAEKQHIGQAIGPFLRKKKLERNIHCVVEEVHASQDKIRRSQSIRAMFSDRRVWLPLRAWWRLEAEDELLKFPQGTYDDFVDALAWVGMKIGQIIAKVEAPVKDTPDRKTWSWWKKQMEFEKRQATAEAGDGW